MTNADLAQLILDAGLGKKFVMTVLNMMDDERCDLNGKVGSYMSDLEEIVNRFKEALQ